MSKRLKALSQVWSRPEGLVEDLVRLGALSIDESSHAIAVVSRYFRELAHPRSSKTEGLGTDTYTYAENPKALSKSNWGLIFAGFGPEAVTPAHAKENQPILQVREPAATMDFILSHVRNSEWSGSSHRAPEGVTVEEGVVLGPDCVIGEGTVIEAGTRIGARVRIGRNTRIGANCRIADDTVIGDDCVLTGLVSLGGQGFGFVRDFATGRRRPRLHVGRVVIGNRVRLGAFVAIDRGVFEDSVVGDDSAFDNVVQVGHNSVIGREAILCGLVGLSGSTELGDRVTLAGLVGTKGHIRIGDDVTVAAQSGVSADVAPGQMVKGYPPRPVAEALKIQALVGKLPDLYERLKKLEAKLS